MRIFPALAAVGLVAGCSAGTGPSSSQSTSESAEAPADAKAADGSAAKVPVSIPQLAYDYNLGYKLPSDKMAETQEAHRGLCDAMGPARCQLLALERVGGADVTGDALLRVRVVSGEAHVFQTALTKAVTDAGGRVTDTTVGTEEVSKNIVDAKARISQREVLVARLTDILRKRTGKVEELVAAERSVAQAQEELDQARGWLTELQGRVAMSNFEIRYSAVAPSTSAGTVGGQLGEATEGSAATFLIGVRGLFTLIIYLLPWLLLAFPVIWLIRRASRKRDVPPA